MVVAVVLPVGQLETRVDGGPDVVVADPPAAEALVVALGADAGRQAQADVVDGGGGAAGEDADGAGPAATAAQGQIRRRGRGGIATRSSLVQVGGHLEAVDGAVHVGYGEVDVDKDASAYEDGKGEGGGDTGKEGHGHGDEEEERHEQDVERAEEGHDGKQRNATQRRENRSKAKTMLDANKDGRRQQGAVGFKVRPGGV